MRWSEKEDRYLVEFFDALGAERGAEDLNRTAISVKARVKKLKETGAWKAYEDAEKCLLRAGVLCGRIDPDMLETFHTVTLAEIGINETALGA